MILHARKGASIDHTSASSNIAALIETVATLPGQRVLNAADPDSPSAIEIARIVARHLGHDWDEVLMEVDDEYIGDHPWNTVHPIVLDMHAAERIGYVPVGRYAETVGPVIDWLVDAVRNGGTERRTMFNNWFAPSHFGYRVEHDYLARMQGRFGSR